MTRAGSRDLGRDLDRLFRDGSFSGASDAWSVPEPQTTSNHDGSFRFVKTVGDFWRNFAAGCSAVPRVQSVVLATHDAFGAAWVNLRVVALPDGASRRYGPYPAERAAPGR